MKNFKIALILTMFMSILSGCAATGAGFVGVQPAPQDMAAIYFYRPKMFSGSGVNLMLVDNGKEISRIQNGQFIRYLATPGTHKFHTDTMAIDKAVEFDVEAGKTYYVRTGMRVGMWVGTWYLSRVYDEEALAEMKACCKSGN